jgi:1-aminocyclopropane-1-carboxylate deaminase
MVAGFAAQEEPRAVLGIDASATVPQTQEQIARIARRTAEAIGLECSPTRSTCQKPVF